MFRHANTVVSIIVLLALLIQPLPAGAAATGLQSGSSTALTPAPEQLGQGFLFRASVILAGSRNLARLEKAGVLVLDTFDSDGTQTALVLADGEQLADLARLGFRPQTADELGLLVSSQGPTKQWLAKSLQPLLAQADALVEQQALAEVAGAAAMPEASAVQALRTSVQALTPEQIAAVANSSSVDDDADGLTNTQEAWWCTDPMDTDTDDDGRTDDVEIQALKDWMANQRAGAPGETPWPSWPFNTTTCPDKDHDSIPNLAERWELGLNMDLESSDRDKFDDGQELFGVTYCPGGDLSCGYGDLPRSSDSGYVGAAMPSWVKAPGKHPLVTAFPVPEVNVVESSLHVQTVTVVTTDHVIASGTEQSYSTAKTEGTGTSVAQTETWNNWEEVSDATTQPVIASSVDQNIELSNTLVNYQSTSVMVQQPKPSALGLVDSLVSLVEAPGKVWNAGVQIGNGINEAIYLTTAYGAPWQWNGHLDEYDEMQAREQLSKCQSGQTCRYPATGMLLLDGGQYAVGQQIPGQSTQNFPAGSSAVNTTLDSSGATSYVYRPIEVSINMPPTQTHTETKGRSWGGSETTTNERYEEHTVTDGEAFSNEESWGNATAVDSSRAADFWFSYQVHNTGTDYALDVKDVMFNIYIGDSVTPACTYWLGAATCGTSSGSLTFPPLEPGEFHPGTSAHLPLTLDQMRAIDLGGTIRIVVEDFSYGADEQYYKDAAGAGVLLAVEDGADDGDESIDNYLIPTWGNDTVLDVLARYFPHSTDTDGNLVAIWTPETRSDTPAWCIEPNHVGGTLWCKHALSAADWWNVYTDGMGDGSEGFQDTPAAPGQVALFRFNKDSDLDGYSDRSEERLGTDASDAASFPKPELIAGLHSIPSGNQVVSTLSLLNTGLYDAYGVEAVMIAPDDSISITNNTVGGSGRVRAQRQVIVGSRILLQDPLPSAWIQTGHAQPAVGGYYTGTVDRTYSFSVTCSLPAGCDVSSGAWSLNWADGLGASGSLNFGAGYNSPTLLAVGAFGLQIGLLSGKVYSGDAFSVDALTPRDTFQYTISPGHESDFTPPVVIVSYNDPQGNHRFVTPISLTSPTDDLSVHSGKMLHAGADVEIVTSEAFDPDAPNTTNLVLQVPATRMVDAHAFLEFIDPDGNVVREEALTQTLETGPNIVPITWNPANFNPPYDPAKDYIVMAFFTDWQGNILGTAARPLSSFQVDPTPAFAMDGASATWNFGSVAQGALLEHAFAFGNTGLRDLKAAVVGTGARADQSIPGQPAWLDTGIDVAVGDAIGIRAGGTVCYGTGSTICYGPGGSGSAASSAFTLPGVSSYSLIGRIGTGAAFLVGSTYVSTAATAGRLYLGTNDETTQYSNNTGTYQTHIEIQGLPSSRGTEPNFGIGPADTGFVTVTLDTYYLPVGPFDRALTLRTSDAGHSSQTLRVQGTVQPYIAPARAVAVSPYRPWDLRVAVSGDRTYRELVTFNDTIAADPSVVQPLRVYNDTQQIPLGVGKEIARADGSDGSVASSIHETASTIEDQGLRSPAAAAGIIVLNATAGASGIASMQSSPPWWNSSYMYRRQMSVTASARGVPSAYWGKGSLDLASLGDKKRADNWDVRVVYWDGSNWAEKDRYIYSNATWVFAIDNAIGPSQADNNYWLYYGNPTASSPPADKGLIFVPREEPNTVALYYFDEEDPPPSEDESSQNNDFLNESGYQIHTAGPRMGNKSIYAYASQYWTNNSPSGFSGGILDNWTIEFWLYEVPPGDSQEREFVIGQWDGNYDSNWDDGHTNSWVFWLAQQGAWTNPRKPVIRWCDEYSTIYEYTFNTTISLNTWHHIALVYANPWKLYVDGSYVGAAPSGITFLKTSQKLALGRSRSLGSGWGWGTFAMDGLRVRKQIVSSFPYGVLANPSDDPAVSTGSETPHTGTISGRVFRDLNSNGSQDAGETGISDVTVTLNTSLSRTTNSSGDYSFTDLTPGNYTVSIVVPSGYSNTTPTSRSVSLDPGGTTTVDFGLLPLASVAGKVFHDTDNNGSQGTGEAGVAGVTVTLSTSATRTTASDGSYTFADLMPGSYSVSVSVPDGYVNTTATTVPVTLTAGQAGAAHFGILVYTIEKVSGSDHANRFFLPESFRGGRRYWVQYGRSLTYSASGSLTAQVEAPQVHYGSAELDVFVASPASSNVFLQIGLDIGCDGSQEWSVNGNYAVPITFPATGLAVGFNRYLATLPPDPDGSVAIPLCTSLNLAGQLYLTDLVLTPDGISDVSIAASDIALNPTNPVEGDEVTVQAVVHNASQFASGALTASFYATSADWGEWYIGSAFVPNVPAGGTAPAEILWNTLGFTGATPVRVVLDPYNRLAETNEANNEATASLTIKTRPDLRVTQIALSNDEPMSGESVTVTLTLRNDGQTAAAASALALYDGNPDAGGTLVCERAAGVAGGGQVTPTCTCTLARPGLHRLFARADRDRQVNEYDEGNNDVWRDVYVGFHSPILLDSGEITSDVAYTTTLGYGAVDEGQADEFGSCGSESWQTFRRDPDGRVVYQFDHLLPGHFYHLDLSLYLCGQAARDETIFVDGNQVAGPVPLGDGQNHRLSLRLDPALYADRAISMTVETAGLGGAIVNEVNLYDVDYRYSDSGGANDPAYAAGRGYGYLNGVPRNQWGTLPYRSYRENQSGNTVSYRYDGLLQSKRYQTFLSFWQNTGSPITQKVQINGIDTGTVLTIQSGTPYSATINVPTSYYVDGTITVSVVRTDASTSAMVNEIAVEERTLLTLPEISDVRVTNIGDTSASISWISADPADGQAHYGPTAGLGAIGQDERGPATVSRTHQVTLLDLTPQTTYYFYVTSADSIGTAAGGALYQFTTGPTLSLPPSDMIYGQVFNPDNSSADGALVYVTLRDADGLDSPGAAAPLSALVDASGWWMLNLGGARTADLGAPFIYDAANDRLDLSATQGTGCAANLTIYTADDSPAASMTLACPTQVTHSLTASWNLVGLTVRTNPVTPAEDALDDIVAQGGSAIEVERWWNGGWDAHVRNLPFNNFTLELGRGYFIRTTSASTWTRTGTPPTSPLPAELYPGWNLISFPKLTCSLAAEDMLVAIAAQSGACGEIDRWYAGNWQGHIKGVPPNNFSIVTDQGYFVKCTQRSTYVPCQGTVLHADTDRPPAVEPAAVTPDPNPGIADIRVTNRRDVAFTVTWRTDRPSDGWIEYGAGEELDRIAHDDRGEDAVSTLHHVTVAGLTPQVAYTFHVHSGESVAGNGETAFQATTAATTAPVVPLTAYGQVLDTTGQPAAGALVRARVSDAAGAASESLSALTDGWGYWTLSLPVGGCTGQTLLLEALGPDGTVAHRIQAACAVQPAPALRLGGDTQHPVYLPLVVR